MHEVIRFQIGKAGVSEGTFQSLRNALKTHTLIRISVLKGAAPTKASVLEMAQKLQDHFKGTISTRVIGFTIVVKRLRSFNSLAKKAK